MLRIATPDDLEAICTLLRSMHSEIGIGRVDDDTARGAISDIIQKGQCVVAEKDGAIVGSVGLTMTQWWYSKDLLFTDQWFFVHPAHRQHGLATRLVNFIKGVADKWKIPAVISVGTTVETLPKLKFFKKHMKPFGGSFIHIPKAS